MNGGRRPATPIERPTNGTSMSSFANFQPGRNTLDGGRSSRSPAQDRLRRPLKNISSITGESFYGVTKPAASSSSKFHVNDSPSNYRNASGSGVRNPYASPASTSTMLTRAKKSAANATPIELSDDEEGSDDERVDDSRSAAAAVVVAAGGVGREDDERLPNVSRTDLSSMSSSSRARHSLSPTQIREASFSFSPELPRSTKSPPLEKGRSFQVASAADEQKVGGKMRDRMQDRNGKLPKPFGNRARTQSLISSSHPATTKLSMASRHDKPSSKAKVTTSPEPAITLELEAVVFCDVCKFEQPDHKPTLIFQPPSTLKVAFVFNDKRHSLELSLDELKGTNRILLTSDSSSAHHANRSRMLKVELRKARVVRDLIDKIEEDLSFGALPFLDGRDDHVNVIFFGVTALEAHAEWQHFMQAIRSRLRNVPPMYQHDSQQYLEYRKKTNSAQHFLAQARQGGHEKDASEEESANALQHSTAVRSTRPRPRPVVKSDASATLPPPKTAESVLDESGSETQDGGSDAPATRRAKGNAESERQKFSFPLSGRSSVSLFPSDFEKLNEGEFLNDSIIDFGLKYMLEQLRQRNSTLYDQIHVFSSFFYKKVNSQARHTNSSYFAVRRWTKDVNIFEKKYLVVPINERLHWFLAVVVNPVYAMPEQHRAQYAELLNKKLIADEASARGETSEAQIKAADKELDDDNLDAKLNSPVDDASADEKLRSTDMQNDAVGQQTGLHFHVNDLRSRAGSDSEAGMDFERGSLLGGGPPSTNATRRKGIVIVPGETFVRGKEESQEEVVEVLKSGRSSVDSMPSERSGPVISADDYEITPGIRTRSRSRKSTDPVDLDAMDELPLPTRARQAPSTEDRRTTLKNKCVVLTFDSLSGRHANVKNVLRRYLQLELLDKFGIEVGADKLWTERVDHIAVAAPQQPNFCDCGLYLLHAFSRFFDQPDLFLEHVIPSGRAEHQAWKEDDQIKSRQWWREVMDELAEQWSELKRERKSQRQALKRDRDESASDPIAAAAAKSSGEDEEGEAGRKTLKLTHDDETVKGRVDGE